MRSRPFNIPLSYSSITFARSPERGRCSHPQARKSLGKEFAMLNCNTPIVANLPASKDIRLTDLTPALYRDLRRIASRHLIAERPNHTLQATALVHEAYLKLASERTPRFSDEVHLLAVASSVMRQVLVDYARSRATQKRNGPVSPLEFTATLQINGEGGPELIDVLMLDDALVALAAEDEQLARFIEMRYFGGMTAEESAEELGISAHVVRHQLRFAHAWLQRKLRAS
jgi:RNA polymerase sigma factor (TIGR02999 family)